MTSRPPPKKPLNPQKGNKHLLQSGSKAQPSLAGRKIWRWRSAGDADGHLAWSAYQKLGEPFASETRARAAPLRHRAVQLLVSLLVSFLGALGTGRVAPRSAGKRSSFFGACPVVAEDRFDAFGTYPSAGWLGSRAGGGAASMLMPSPSIRGGSRSARRRDRRL
jgi:hypothetical protein